MAPLIFVTYTKIIIFAFQNILKHIMMIQNPPLHYGEQITGNDANIVGGWLNETEIMFPEKQITCFG